LTQQDPCLYVPATLLPAFSTPPLSVTVELHEPVALTSIVFQLVAEGRESDVHPSEVDLSEVLQQINGAQGDVLREGDTVHLASSHGAVTLRALMLEPVRQGVPSSTSSLVLSPTPYTAPPDEDDIEYLEDGESSRAPSRISMHEFDPDAFLSGSLSLQARAVSDDDLANGHADGSWGGPNGWHGYGTETSGSTTPRAFRPVSPVVPVEEVLLDGDADEADSGTRFTAIPSAGPAGSGEDVDVCWVGVGGLGRAGIFEGDWVVLRPTAATQGTGRLVKVLAWEQLDELLDDLPANPILVPPIVMRSFGIDSAQLEVSLAPTPFGAREPTLPVAKSMTVARIATTEGVDKRYERAWLHGLARFFRPFPATPSSRLVRRGDVFAVPVYRDRPVSEEDELSEDEGDDRPARASTGLAYFVVTALSFDPLVPVEEDFRSSASAKARAGELGCWAEVGLGGETRMVLTGLERARVGHREWDRAWSDISGFKSRLS
jgi:peroxin-6